jgi:Protein of unknown function (DUF1353)
MSRFTSILLVSPLADGRTWVIRCDFGYDVGSEGSGDTIDVPVGFRTDFASVPRVLWVFLPPWGRYGNAAVIHDYLYWVQSRSRQEADSILLEAMDVLGVSPLQKLPIYWAVRVAGWIAWRGNQRLRRSGFEKVGHALPSKSIEVP